MWHGAPPLLVRLLLGAPLAVAAGAPNLTAYPLGGEAKCISGCTAYVQAAVQDTSVWVLTLGSESAGVGWCVSEAGCIWESQQACGSSAPAPAPLNIGGLQYTDCDENPLFCRASHGVVPMCDMALFLGDGVATTPNGTQLHLRGQSILSESVKRLAALGMSKATHVLLHGFNWGGTAAVLHADNIGKMVRDAVPGLQVYKVLPVDADHPDFTTMMCTADIMAANCNGTVNKTDCHGMPHHGPVCPVMPPPGGWNKENSPGTWLIDSLNTLYNLTKQAGALKQLPAGCPDSPDCMWFEHAAPKVAADMFHVQEAPGVWDMHCNFEGEGPGVGNFPDLVGCSQHGNFFFLQYQCAQYPDHCNDQLVRGWEIPLQERYLADARASGHPGFVHSCFLGAYFNSQRFANNVLQVNTSWYHQIRVGGASMYDAIAAWWNGTEEKKLYQDCTWHPAGVIPANKPNGSGPGANPQMPWYTSQYMCNPSCWGNPFY